MQMEIRSIDLLGVTVHPVTIGELGRILARAVKGNEKRIIANHNLNSIAIYHRDARMRAFFSKTLLNHIDGMPLIYWARILGHKLRRDQRVTYVDWIGPLMEQSEKNQWRVFYLGSRPGVAERAIQLLKEKFPRLQISSHHGYFSVDPHGRENARVIGRINAFGSDILMVGMGMPRQEHWILNNLEKIDTRVILNAGACFDYVAGVVSTPPRWMGQWGLEWLWRLVSDPKRLARRYLVDPFTLVPYLLGDLRERYLKS